MRKHFLGLAVLIMIAISAYAEMKSTAGFDYVKMERTTCYGTCPNYVIEMYANGLVRYTGRRFAKPGGTYEKNIGKAKVKAILNSLSEYRVDTCAKEYKNLIADVPGIYFTFKKGKTTSRINNAHFGPGFLKGIAKEMDETMGTPGKGWKKTAGYKVPE